MSEEIRMREFDVNEVEPEDIIQRAREAERKAAEEEQRKLYDVNSKPKRDPIQELADLLDKANEEIAKRKKQNLRSCGLFSAAAIAVIGCMLYGLAEPVFALPLAAVYCMRGAVHYDRWARM